MFFVSVPQYLSTEPKCDSPKKSGGGMKKKRPQAVVLAVLVVIRVGFEPTTPSLKGMCSTS